MNHSENVARLWADEVAARVDDARAMGRQCWLGSKPLAYWVAPDHGSWMESLKLMEWAEGPEFRSNDLLGWANRFNSSVKYLQAIWLEGYYSARLEEFLEREVAK